MKIGDVLRERRIAVGMTQNQVATAAGMNITQYNGYECGRSRPADSTLDRLAAALQTTTDSFTVVANPARPASAPGEGLSVPALSQALREAIARDLGLGVKDVILRIELCLQQGHTAPLDTGAEVVR